MPLSKQAKALYEAALRRKGLQPGKAVRQDPRTFVGPYDVRNTYVRGRGRLQDLLDEMRTEVDAQRREPAPYDRFLPGPNAVLPRDFRYYDFYGPADRVWRDIGHYDSEVPWIPDWIGGEMGESYNDPTAYKFLKPYISNGEMRYDKGLTRLGEMEYEARYDAAVENAYKKMLRDYYSGKTVPKFLSTPEELKDAKARLDRYYNAMDELPYEERGLYDYTDDKGFIPRRRR